MRSAYPNYSKGDQAPGHPDESGPKIVQCSEAKHQLDADLIESTNSNWKNTAAIIVAA
jgi:hypothetical protein